MSTIDTISRKPFPHKSHSYLAGLVLVGCLLPIPIVATIFTAAIYIAPIPMRVPLLISSWISLNWLAIIAGLGITLVFWFLSALFFRNFTSMERANPWSGSHLQNHFSALRAGFAALQALNDNGKSLPKERFYSYQIAHEQVKAYLEEIEGLLDRKDMRWIAGSGYLQAWSLVHRAEEAMFTLEPREEVIRNAIYDEMCLVGSNITAQVSALNKLELAVKNLSAAATQYLDSTGTRDIQKVALNSKGQNSTTQNERTLVATKHLGDTATSEIATRDEKNIATDEASSVTVHDPSIATTNGTPKVANEEPSDTSDTGTSIPIAQYPDNSPPSDKPVALANDARSAPLGERPASHVIAEMEARNALRDTRRTINEYRSHLWEGLVNGRNLLMGTVMITALLTYVLFCFAIIAGATPVAITAATAFYLVGAVVGLFSRLYDESKADNASNDYNLTLARIIVTPVLSGIAGVVGVLLTTMLSLTLLKSAFSQTSDLASTQLGLADSFNLQRNSLGILIAAAFALAPNLLINTLKEKANDFTDKLRNSGASDQATSSNQPLSSNKP
jgi:hypothetical protein